MDDKNEDEINLPSHYQGKFGYDVINAIEAFSLSYNLGTAVAYLIRANKKGNWGKDLNKAIEHIKRELQPSAKNGTEVCHDNRNEIKLKPGECLTPTSLEALNRMVNHDI